MTNVKVSEFKIKVDGKERVFRLDFSALMRFEEKFGAEAMVFFNEFLQGKEVYKNIVRILTCSCTDEDFTEEQLAKGLSFDLQTMQLVDEITLSLIQGVVGEGNKKEENQAKN